MAYEYHTWDCMDGDNLTFVQLVYHCHTIEPEQLTTYWKILKLVHDISRVTAVSLHTINLRIFGY